MYNELKHNLKVLFKESQRLSKTDINGKTVQGVFNLYGIKSIIVAVSILVITIKRSGFSSEFLGFVTSYLSILIGLFITALIFSFDKFYDTKEEEAKKIDNNAKLQIWDVQAYNYTKKFAFMTSQTIVISVFVLAIVALKSLFPSLSKIDIWEYRFIAYEQTTFTSVFLFIKNSVAIILRFLTLYWLFSIMVNTLYIVSGMVDYMITKNDRKK